MHEAPPRKPLVHLFASLAVVVLVTAGIAMAAPSTVPEPATSGVIVDAADRPVDSAAHTGDRPQADRLLLKLRAGSATCLGCRLRAGQALGSLGVGSRLDGLLRTHGVRAARPLLRPSAHADARTRFPARTARASANASSPAFDRTWILTVRAHPDLAALARELAADPAVEYCEPDAVMRVALVPNDPFFASQGSWGQPFDDLWGAKRIGAPAAWDVTRGAGVLVAVVDTGIDATHPDIAANLWTNPGEIPGNGIDDDGNGFVDDVRGWDFADGDDDPTDDYSHGTHVAGTIAAVGNNGSGITGVAFESHVMAVRALGTFGFGFSSDLAAAILYAVDNGADVINASWGGGFSQTIADAVSAAHAAGVVFVAAAGNSAADTADFFPAANPDAMTVSAFTHADTRAGFSNFGLKLDVAAPGGGDLPPPGSFSADSILSLFSSATAPANVPPSALVLQSGGASYVRYAGTSMATPHVVGVVALAIASHPGISVEQVRQLLRSTADDLDPPGFDVESGYGLVNAAASVTAPLPLEAHIASPAGTRLLGPALVSVTGSAQGPGFTSYTLDYRPDADPEGWLPIVGPIATPVDDAELATWDMTSLLDGDYVLRLHAERPGETFTDQTRVSVRNIAISAPESLAALRPDAPIEIRGTAAGPGLVGYTVEMRRPALHGQTWHTDGITLAAPPGTAVRDGLLATLDVSGLTEGDRFDFRLTVSNAGGTTEVIRRGTVIDPTLRPGWPQAVIPGGEREYLTVADLDPDGRQEVVVGSGAEVVVFEPDGSVRPGWPQSVALTNPFAVTHGGPLVADVIGDTRPEVIASNGRELFVWSGDGVLQPGFPVVSFSLSLSGNSWLSAGDLDGDGKDEIVCAATIGLEVYRGNGTILPPFFGGRDANGPAAVGDVVGDLRAELAWYNAPKGVLTGKGILSLIGPDGFELAARKVSGTTFTRTWLADMDGDGRLDMIVLARKPNTTRPIKVSMTSALGKNLAFRKPKVKGIQALPSRQLAFSDLDGDGRAEAWIYIRTPVNQYFAEEIGHFAPFQVKTNQVQQPVVEHRLFQYPLFVDGPFSMAIGDIDGDGVQELVGGMVGTGCGRATDLCVSDTAPGAPIRRALPVQHVDGTLVDSFPKPIPQFFTDDDTSQPFTISGFSDDPYAATPTIADLDGDGLKEVLWWDPESSRIFVWNVAGTPGPLLADWPMYAHDAKHSNTLPVH